MESDFASYGVGEPSNNIGHQVTFDIGTRAIPLDTRQSSSEETIVLDDREISNNGKVPKPPDQREFSENNDNFSVANSDIGTRNTAVQRQLSYQVYKPAVSTMEHSHSTSDLVRLRNPHRRINNREPKSLILPISRPRSPFSVHSQSFDGLSNVVQPFNRNADPNLSASGDTPQDDFAPFSYSNDGYLVSNGEVDLQSNYNPSRKPYSPTGSSPHLKQPTPPEAKKQMFTDILSTSMSTIYAILIVTLGVALYVVDALQLEHSQVHYLAEGFSLALLTMALLYLLYLNFDIAIYNKKKRNFLKLMENISPEHMEMKETNQGIAYDVILHKALDLQKQLDHRYCFSMDRHSSNFYLKIGAAGFCFGHLIHSVLVLTYRGVIIGSSDQSSSECNSIVSFITEILYPFYSVVLLFFIFKYSNVIINKNRDFHRFGFMHCLASSLCFWLWTIFRETTEYIYNSSHSDYDGNTTMEEDHASSGEEDSSSAMKVRIIKPFRFTSMCEHDELNVVYQNYSPYLYPFSVEYSILVVGIIYIVWINIGLCHGDPDEAEKSEHHHEDIRECRNDRRQSEPESNITIHADCHASNKGLFGGFIVLVFAIVSIIMFFITHHSTSTELAETGLTFNATTKLAIVLFMGIAVVAAYFQIAKLDANEAAHNSLDNFLCLICLPAFFIHGIFSIIPAIIYGKVLTVMTLVFENVQVVIQTSFIIDGMSRSSNTKQLRKKKPGREFVTFLVICNVAMWLMQTFEVKSHGLDHYRQDFYSKEFWSIVGHAALPLMMFYRFHSSVCIGDIWKFAYMPSGH